MGRSLWLFLSISLALDGSYARGGVIWYVTSGGSGTRTGTSWASAFPTIAAGLAAAASGDEVRVHRGEYHERITLKAGVKLSGGYLAAPPGPDQWAATTSILDGDEGGTVVTVERGAGLDTQLLGFTIRRGNSESGVITRPKGAGLQVSFASATVKFNKFVENQGTAAGAICLDSSSAWVEANEITDNGAAKGAGIYIQGGSPTVARNLIRRNTAGTGAGLYVGMSSAAVIACNVIQGNMGTHGSGVQISGGALLNNTIIGNKRSLHGAVNILPEYPVYAYNNIVAFNANGVYVSPGATGLWSHNDVYGNTLGNYTGIPDQTGINGNISKDPAIRDVTADDYHPILGSPCVDTGEASVIQAGWWDVYGSPRIQGAAVDIGAGEAAMAVPKTAVRVKPASSGGNDANSGDTWDLAKATVQAAVTKAQAEGKEVWVAAGTYNESVRIDATNVMVFGGFAGTPSEDERCDRDPEKNVTILDSTGLNASVLNFSNVRRDTVVDGFTIRNGAGTLFSGSVCGGGIYCAAASPVLTNNIVVDNATDAYGLGGGIYARYSAPYIACNAFRRNTAREGGGLYLIGAYTIDPALVGEVRQNIVEGNVATNWSGGIHVGNSDYVVAVNEVAGNQALGGGGIVCRDGHPSIRGNRVIGNTIGGIDCEADADVLNNTILANTGSGITVLSHHPLLANNLIVGPVPSSPDYAGFRGINVHSASAIIYHNTVVRAGDSAVRIFYGSGGPFDTNLCGNIFAYSGTGLKHEPASGTGTVTAWRNSYFATAVANYAGVTPDATDSTVDPRFVNPAGDYHLRFDSPCIDRGDDAVLGTGWRDIDNRARRAGVHADLGADEFDPAEGTGIGGVTAALRMAAGIESSSVSTLASLDVVLEDTSFQCIDLRDAARLLRIEFGLP